MSRRVPRCSPRYLGWNQGPRARHMWWHQGVRSSEHGMTAVLQECSACGMRRLTDYGGSDTTGSRCTIVTYMDRNGDLREGGA